MDKKYPNTCRLRKSWEYSLVKKMGCKYHTPHFVLLIADNSIITSRLGITVSRKVGNAIQRNRLKRLIREFFRNNRFLFSGSSDYSVIAKRKTALLSTVEIELELKKLFYSRLRSND